MGTGLLIFCLIMKWSISSCKHELLKMQEENNHTSETEAGDADVSLELLQQLRNLDIPEEDAKKALLLTGNVSAEDAAMFYFNLLDNKDEEESDEDEGIWYKMVFVVNMELNMGVGKVAAQVGHAAVGLYQIMQEESTWKEMCLKWDQSGAKKIVLQGSNAAHLLELQGIALSLGLPNYTVQDAGRTQRMSIL
ncbi:probable peptidyl-tRNA hydrolase 2 [Protopterus annectens]|uniref:probable peptidyl-tRNA hydrolase 2 n=1 Tax=Protopterus annectens TaxID=7888 RepID=UPI001CFC3708|nr:probable peptidyl-tRNA hydrolase 2 [Protopterus annectens]